MGLIMFGVFLLLVCVDFGLSIYDKKKKVRKEDNNDVVSAR